MPCHISHTRIFVTLTLDEAAAVGRLKPDTSDVHAVGAMAKIRTALEGTTPAPRPPAPLRAKDCRMAKAALRAPHPHPPPRAASADTALDEYTPHRDEAGGLWK